MSEFKGNLKREENMNCPRINRDKRKKCQRLYYIMTEEGCRNEGR